MKKLFLLGLLVQLSTACYYDNKEDLYQNFPNDCDLTSVTYSGDIEPILQRSCAYAGCHGGASPQAGLDLTQHSEAKRIADNGKFFGRITGTDGPLMPQGGPKLPQCEIDKIKTWIDAGAPNN